MVVLVVGDALLVPRVKVFMLDQHTSIKQDKATMGVLDSAAAIRVAVEVAEPAQLARPGLRASPVLEELE